MSYLSMLSTASKRPRRRPPRAGRPRRLNRLGGAVIVLAAIGASVVATAVPAAANGTPPGTLTTNSGSFNLSGSFAGVSSAAGTFGFNATYPTWVAANAIDVVTGTITPAPAVDNALTGLGASSCVLRTTSLKVTVDVTGTNSSSYTLDLGYQTGPMTSALPALSFQLPQLYIGPLVAPATGNGNMTVLLKSIKGTVHCFNSSGKAVAANTAVNYTGGKGATESFLAQTSYGIVPPDGAISGTVTDDNSNPVAGASVQACGIGYQCTPATTTAANGTYSLSVPPGQYIVLAAPPTSITTLNRGDAGSVTVTSSTTSTSNVVLDTSEPLPSNVTMPSNNGNLPTVPPTENWNHPFTITVTGCPGGTATWQLQGWNTQTAAPQTLTGTMTETPPGTGTTYVGTVPPLIPIHGPVVITLTINCPGGSTQTTTIDAYIDPSGTVVNQYGAPIAGATVTLSNGPSLTGPWTQVPNGDTAIMSPSNTANPSTTGAMGQYGWDVVEGDYQLTATAVGCSTYTTPGFPIPPPQIGLILTLTCKNAKAPAWSVSSGGNFTGKSDTVKITDTRTKAIISCSSSAVTGTLNSGSGLNGTGIGSVNELSLDNCTGPRGLTLTVTPNTLPLALNAVSYKAGVTTAMITGINATLSGSDCSATVDGTAADAADGQVKASYSNSKDQLTVVTTGGNLAVYNVSGCAGLINDGDGVTVSGSFKLSPAQTITGP